MREFADLHTHTDHSDGALKPSELVARAKQAGISILAITDHDSISGVQEGLSCGKAIGVEVLPGIEMSVSFEQRELHLLAYCFDPDNSGLKKCLSLFHDQRIQRAERIVKKLNGMNIPLTMEHVFKQVTAGVVCRPHIADAMVSNKLASSYIEVFVKYIGDGCPAYEKKPEFRLETAVNIVAEAGGLTFLAHPGTMFTQKDIVNIIKTGIDGIETVHPSHTGPVQEFYRGITNEYYLLECGGSDYHGGSRSDERNFGLYGVSTQAVELMRQRLLRAK